MSANEGNDGTTTFTFTVSLSQPAATGGLKFDIATHDGTATTAGSDYVARSLTNQLIPAGQSSYSFDVTVNGDTLVESDENFFVNVSNVSANALIGDGQGAGTIQNDDTPLLVISQLYGGGGNAGATLRTTSSRSTTAAQLRSTWPVGLFNTRRPRVLQTGRSHLSALPAVV